MPKLREIPIPINLGLNKALDEIGLRNYAAALQDCIVDEEGNVHRRPGLEDLCDLGTGAKIDGLYWWPEEECVVAISNGETYKITANDGTNSQVSGDALEIGTRVIFADYGSSLYMANGGRILKLADALNFDAQSGSFTAGNTVYQMVDGVVVAQASIASVSQDGSEGTLYLDNVIGEFQDNEIIYEATYGSELVINGDMELDANWNDYGTSTNERSSEQKHADTYSWKFIGNEAADGIGSDAIAVTADSFYIYDGYLYISALTATAVATYIAETTGYSADSSITTTTSTGAFQQCTGVFQADTNEVKFVSMQSGAGAVTAYLDDASLKKITNAALANGTVTSISYISDADAPINVTHPQVMDTYLMGNLVDTGQLHYSTVLAPTTWPGDYVTAETKPDTLMAVIANNAKIYLMGQRTLEPWVNDGSTPFVKEIQGFINSGTIARYSFCMCGDVLYWLDNERNVVRMAAGSITPQVISITMNAYIQGFTVVNDALGDYVSVGGRAYYVLTFPSEEKTLAWDLVSNRWYEWGYWHTASATYKNWLGNCHCFCDTWNMALVGDRSTGKIYKLNATNYDDAGDTLRTLVRTGHLDYGTNAVRKISHCLMIEATRTNVVNEAAITTMTLRYRDNGSSTWKNERTVTLGQVGDTGFRGFLRRNGSFYTRQYEFVLSDDTPLSLNKVTDLTEFCTI